MRGGTGFSGRLPLREWLPFVAIATLLRVWLAISDHGVFWPDEIFQSLEPAHIACFGYGFRAWEFQEGARSWVFPGALAALFWVVDALGVGSAPVLVMAAKLAMVANSLLALVACLHIAHELGGPGAARVAGVYLVFFPSSLVFSHRCMAEVASAAPLAWATYFWLGSRVRAAGVLLGLAIFFRFQNGLWALGLLTATMAAGTRKATFLYLQGLLASCAVGATVDALTWGWPFHSPLRYLEFNLLEGQASSFGTAPPSYYLQVAWTATGPVALLVAVGFAWSARIQRSLFAISVGFVLAHSLIPHKEWRFLMPAMPIVLALSGVGTRRLWDAVWARFRVKPMPAIGAALTMIVACALSWHTSRLTFERMGQYDGEPWGTASVFHHLEPYNRLLWRAGREVNLCGLAVVGQKLIFLGGYSYLHRDVPFYRLSSWSSAQLDAANYIVGPLGLRVPPGYQEVAASGGLGLFRRSGGCAAPPPNYSRNFPK